MPTGKPDAAGSGATLIHCEVVDTPDGKFGARAVITDANRPGFCHVIEPSPPWFDDSKTAVAAARAAARAWVATEGHENGNG